MDLHQENSVNEEYFTFIGKNAEKYLVKFQKFHVDGTDQFSATWHWPAFFFPFFWMLYRKMYLWSLLVLVLNFTVGLLPGGFLIPMAVFGISANYMYYKHMQKKLSELHQINILSDTQKAATIARTGGVNNLALLLPLLLIPLMGIVAAIAVPNLLTAIQRSKRSRTAADMRAIGTALGSFQVDENQFPIQRTEGNLSNEILPGSYYEGVFSDGWQTPFRYVSDGKTYKLISYGKDKKAGKTSTEFDEDIIYADGRFIAPEYLTRF